MSLTGDAQAWQTKLDAARVERDQAKAAERAATKEVERLRGVAALLDVVESYTPSPPKWLSKSKARKRNVVPVGILSDLHLDEVVNPDELLGRNAYNRAIALQRLKRYTAKSIELIREHRGPWELDGAVLMLGGDLVSGVIHQELAETNEGTLFETLEFWPDQIAAVIDAWAAEFGHVYVPCTYGNHGRDSRKPRFKVSARHNADWLICRMIAKAFAKDDRVQVDVPDALECHFDVLGWRYLLHHGNSVNGGGGIGGIWPPIMRDTARKREREIAYDTPFDLSVLGHWHSWTIGAGFVINGTTKGVDEYAHAKGFSPEPPQQGIWYATEHLPVAMPTPVLVSDRKAEGW